MPAVKKAFNAYPKDLKESFGEVVTLGTFIIVNSFDDRER